MKKAAEDGDEDAKKHMAKVNGEDKEEPKKAAAAEGEGEEEKEKPKMKKAAAASEDEEEKKEKEEREQARAEIREFRAEQKAARDLTEKQALLAGRPDFTDEMKASFLKPSVPLSTVKDVCDSWARGTLGKPSNAAAANTSGTMGAGQGGPPKVSDADADFIANHMGGVQASNGVKTTRGGSVLELGYVSPTELAKGGK
jgi:hypothetical protein